MSQGSLTIPTTGTLSGLSLVQDANAALANLASMASGTTDPSTLPGGVLPFSLWADTSVTPNTLRQRNAANNAWITVGDLTQPNLGLNQGTYSVRGLSGSNNATTPNTKFDFSADAVTLRNPSNGAVVTKTNAGTITCDVGLAGSAANGRDQAGAFAASSWVHFYFIWNGSTLATLASTVAPPTGPTLPAGYTHWAYIGPVYFNAASQLLYVFLRGKVARYAGGINVLAGGSTTNPTAVSLATGVPPNAETAYIAAALNYYDAGTLSTLNLNLYVVQTNVFAQIGVTEPVSNTSMKQTALLDMPNVGQTIYYAWDTGVGVRSASIAIIGYTIPNGG